MCLLVVAARNSEHWKFLKSLTSQWARTFLVDFKCFPGQWKGTIGAYVLLIVIHDLAKGVCHQNIFFLRFESYFLVFDLGMRGISILCSTTELHSELRFKIA